MKLFSECFTVEDWIKYYSDATRQELNNSYHYLTQYGAMSESEENRLQAVKTLLDEEYDNRYYD